MQIKILFEFHRFFEASKRHNKSNSFQYMLKRGGLIFKGGYKVSVCVYVGGGAYNRKFTVIPSYNT